jgi:hypothetical protein
MTSESIWEVLSGARIIDKRNGTAATSPKKPAIFENSVFFILLLSFQGMSSSIFSTAHLSE